MIAPKTSQELSREGMVLLGRACSAEPEGVPPATMNVSQRNVRHFVLVELYQLQEGPVQHGCGTVLLGK